MHVLGKYYTIICIDVGLCDTVISSFPWSPHPSQENNEPQSGKVLVFLGSAPVNDMVKVLKLRTGGMRGTSPCRHVCGKTSMLSPWEHAVSPRCWNPAYLCRPAMERDRKQQRVSDDWAIQSHIYTRIHMTHPENLSWTQLQLDQGDQNALPIRDGAD